MKLTLRVWRQRNADADGAMSTYEVDGISADMSFLEMLDTLNEELILKGDDPVAFDHDCREGICGACSLVINGDAHGPERTTTCQLHMRSFTDGDTIDVEPWRAAAFPVVKDLVVDRSAFDRIIQAAWLRHRPDRRRPRGPRHPRTETGRRLRLRTRRVHRLRRLRGRLPERRGHALHLRQGQPPERAAAGAPERETRVLDMVAQMDEEGFGGCTLAGECATACPKGIPLVSITGMNKEWLRAARREASR